MVIARAVARNRREPSAKGRRGAQRAEPPEREQEDVLHQVIHFVRRHASQQDTVHHAPVAAIDLAERSAVTVARRDHELCVLGDLGHDRRHGLTFPDSRAYVNASFHSRAFQRAPPQAVKPTRRSWQGLALGWIDVGQGASVNN